MESRTARNLSIKIDVDGASACIITRDRKISGGGRWRKEGFWSSASCIRQSTDSIVGVNIWRKYGGSPFLLSSFRAYRRRWGAGNRWDVCEIIFRRARSTLSEISDEWKAFFFFHLFSFPPPFSFSFVFFSLSADLGLGREDFRENRSPLRGCRFLERRNIDVVY